MSLLNRVRFLFRLRFLFLAALLAACLPLAAFAQVVAPAPAPAAPGAPGGSAWVTAIFQYVVAPLIPAIGAAALAALTYLATFLRTKGKNSKVAGAFAVVTDFVEHALEHILVGMKEDFKAALADGVLTATERADLLAKLLKLVKAELPGGILATLQGVFGAGLDTWLSGKASAMIDQFATPSRVIASATVEAPAGGNPSPA